MSLRNRLALPVVLSAIAVLAACGGTNSVTPPPSGAFNNTDLNGTYTFSVAGADVALNGSGNPSIAAMAGSFTACGCTQGTISTGMVDLIDQTAALPGSTIGNNSTYSITADGRGKADLQVTPAGGTAMEVIVDFVLTSSSHGLITRYDQNGSGSGTIDLQTSGATVNTTPYSFFISGGDNGGTALASAGAFTADSSGTIASGAGVEDFNLGGTPYTALGLTGSIAAGSGTTPGAASLLTSFSSNPLNFDVYTIDSTHFKLIESDGAAVLVGDVYTQNSTTIPSGTLAFNMSGLDSNENLFATGGVMTVSGSTISNGLEDVNDDGVVDGGTNPATPYSFVGNGPITATGLGRSLVPLSGYVGGANFAAYPSSGGVLMLEVDTGLNAGVTSGIAAVQQSGAQIAASQGYGLNLTGEDVTVPTELDEIAEFKTTSTAATGLADVNDFGSLLNTENVNGTYTANTASSPSGSMSFNQWPAVGLFYYAVDSSTAFFISVDPGQAALGSFQVQTAPTSGGDLSASAHTLVLPTPRLMPHGKNALLRTKNRTGLTK